MDKLIHVRFLPNGAVLEIGERPEASTPQQWFDHLSRKAGNHYQTLSGGRGVFRVNDAELNSLKTTPGQEG